MINLSVIVPIYNSEKYLNQCVDSIIAQTYSEIEIILVNDGSTDRSGKICDEYKNIDRRVQVIHQENLGLVFARLRGVQLAKGKYIGFVDSDDWIAPDMYEILMSKVEKKDYDIVSISHIVVNEDTEKSYISDSNFLFGEFKIGKTFDELYMRMLYDVTTRHRGVHPALWSKIIKKELLIKELTKIDKRITLGEDAAIFYPCCLNATCIYIMKEYKYFYRVRKASMCHSYTIETFKRIEYFNLYMQKILKNYDTKYNLLKQLKEYIWIFINTGLNQVFDIQIKEGYVFPYEKIERDADIILYGAGKVGKSYYQQLKKNCYCNIVAWIDKNAEMKENLILLPEKICELNYSKIVIAIIDEMIVHTIIEELMDLGVDKKKIIWELPKEIPLQIL